MNIALAGMACGQILSLFEYAFGYPESQESKDRGRELEELEHHFQTDNESTDDEDTFSKEQDVTGVAQQFSDTPPKPKRGKFGKCKDDLPDLVPLHKVVPIIPSTTIKLSETGVPCSYYSTREGSEGQSIYRCFLKRLETEPTFWLSWPP